MHKQIVLGKGYGTYSDRATLVLADKENLTIEVINGENVYNLPGYVSKDGYDIEFEYETNINGLSFNCEHPEWFDVLPFIKEYGGKFYCSAKLSPNTDEDIRNVVVLAQRGSETVGKLTIKQDISVAEPYIWIVSSGNTGTYLYSAPASAT